MIRYCTREKYGNFNSDIDYLFNRREALEYDQLTDNYFPKLGNDWGISKFDAESFIFDYGESGVMTYLSKQHKLERKWKKVSKVPFSEIVMEGMLSGYNRHDIEFYAKGLGFSFRQLVQSSIVNDMLTRYGNDKNVNYQINIYEGWTLSTKTLKRLFKFLKGEGINEKKWEIKEIYYKLENFSNDSYYNGLLKELKTNYDKNRKMECFKKSNDMELLMTTSKFIDKIVSKQVVSHL